MIFRRISDMIKWFYLQEQITGRKDMIMKLKYKKAAVLVSMCTMLIGLVGFSIGTGAARTSKEAKPQNTPSLTVQTTEPEPEMDKSSDEKINLLVQKYFKASVEKDMEVLADLVTNIEYVDKKQLEVKYQYVEDVKNIECYVEQGPEEGTYLTYVYSELKIKDIDTLAPGLSRFYIVTGEDGALKVFFGADSAIEEFIEKADASEEIQKLAAKVQTRLEEALSSDEKLQEFNERLTEKGKEQTKGQEE